MYKYIATDVSVCRLYLLKKLEIKTNVTSIAHWISFVYLFNIAEVGVHWINAMSTAKNNLQKHVCYSTIRAVLKPSWIKKEYVLRLLTDSDCIKTEHQSSFFVF